MTGPEDQHGQSQPTTGELIESVRELISMMTRGGINELDLTTGDVSIRLRGQSANVSAPATPPASVPTAHAPVSSPEEPEGEIIASPMIGTYYAAPSPGEAPFVQVGDHIEVGQVIGIIEAMKIMNEITADHSGVVVDVLVENAQPVEYGSPLLRVSPADSSE